MVNLPSLGAFGSAGGVFLTWVSSITFWFIVAGCSAITIWGGLYMRKNNRMNKPVLEIIDVGAAAFNYVYDKQGNIDIEKTTVDWSKSSGSPEFKIGKGGWFKNKWTLFNLWDYGPESIFQLKDGTRVYGVSHNDYRIINGQKGIVVVRVPQDPKFVIPISKIALSPNSRYAMMEIAPMDLRNEAIAAIEQVDREMQTKWEKYAPLITAAFLGMVLIFSILLIAQYGKHNIDSTTELLKYVTDKISVSAGQSP